MHPEAVDLPDNVARALALVTAADACISRREMARLDALDAFRHIGVSRSRFVQIAYACRSEIGENLVGLSWLPAGELDQIDRILDAVRGQPARLLVCRLSAAALAADPGVTDAARRVFDHMLTRWRIYRSMLTPAAEAADPGRAGCADGGS